MKTKKILILLSAIIVLLVAFGIILQNNKAEVPKSDIKTGEKNMEDTSKVTELQKEILQEGSGETIKAGQKATVHYTGTLLDGIKFDSSLDRGTPFSFDLGAGMVIAGWDQGVEGMKVGEKIKLTIPANLAYGDRGVPGVIPAGATLIFEVELLEID